LYQRFERTAGRIVEITRGSPTPTDKDPRTVKVVPVDTESELRNRDWSRGTCR